MKTHGINNHAAVFLPNKQEIGARRAPQAKRGSKPFRLN
jgi:hypothetical protein